MQVNLVSPTGQNRSQSSTSREALLSELIQTLQPDEAAQTRRAQIVARRAEKQRRKDERQDAAVAQAAAELRPSEQMQQAERDLTPGSRAAQREQWRDVAQKSAESGHRDFRRALADASARGHGDRSSSAPRAATDTVRSAKNSATPSTDSQASTAGSSTTASPGRTSPERVSGGTTPTTTTTTNAVRMTPVATATTPTSPVSTTGAAAATAVRAATTSAAAGRVTAVSASAATAGSTSRSSGPVVSAVESNRGSVIASKNTPRVAAQTEATTESNSDANLERILRVIQSRIGKDRAVATLRLDPPELGSIRLRMDLRQEQLLLQVETQTPEAQRLLEGELDTLRRNLEAAGIQLERVEIRTATPAQQASDSQTQPQAEGWTGAQHHTARQDAGSAGSGPSWETEAPFAESSEMLGGDAEPEPAAESLVNVLA